MITAAPPVLAFRRRAGGQPLALDPALLIGRSDAYNLLEIDTAPALASLEEVRRAVVQAGVSTGALPVSDLAGSADLRFVVNADGSVDPATVTVRGAPSDVFASVAAETGKVLRFTPALKDGEPVAVWIAFTLTLPLEP